MRSHATILPAYIQRHLPTLATSALCVLDADLPLESLHFAATFCQQRHIPLWYNPTDLRKSTKVVDARVLSNLTFMSPNTKELVAIFSAAVRADPSLDQAQRQQLTILGSKYSDGFAHLQDQDLFQILKARKFF
jgi:hypothetical protein